MAVTWLTPVDVTPGTASVWTDVDITAHVSGSATGALLHIVNESGSSALIGWRKNGSSDARINGLANTGHMWCGIGIDANDIFEVYLGSTSMKIWLVGYTEAEATFFTNAVDKSLSSTDSWIDIDVSSDTGGDVASAVFVEVKQGTQGQEWGLRQNGSSDEHYNSGNYYLGAIIGVDSSEIFEGKIRIVSVDFFVNGYFTSGVRFYVNGINVSLSSIDSWIDLTALDSGATGGFIEIVRPNDYGQFNAGLRKNGSAENIYLYPGGQHHCFGMVECDTSQLIEGEISNTDIDFYVVGVSGLTSFSKSLSVDAILKASGLTKVFTADAIIGIITETKIFITDAILVNQFQKTISTDALLKATLTKSLTSDSILKASFIKTFSVDSILKATFLKTFNVDSILKASPTKTLTTDAFLTKSGNKTLSVDSILINQITKTFTADSLLFQTIIVSPKNASSESSPVYLLFTTSALSTGVTRHFELQVDQTSNAFGDIEVSADSLDDETNWEYWNGTTWTALPVDGLLPAYYGNDVRFQTTLTAGNKWWRVREKLRRDS